MYNTREVHLNYVLKKGPHHLEAKDASFSRKKRGFEFPWGYINLSCKYYSCLSYSLVYVLPSISYALLTYVRTLLYPFVYLVHTRARRA